MAKNKQAPDKKVRNVYRGGVTGALILLAALLAAVMLNLLASALPRSATKLDLTADGVYTLSGETRERLAALDEDVTLTLMAPAGEEDTVLLSILEQYAAASPRVRLEEKDPALYPHFAEQYTDEAVGSNSVLVTGEKRAKYLSYEDLYRTDVDEELYYATGSEGVSTVFVGESRITSALAYVTGEKLPKICVLTGHGEAALPESFAEALSRENYETEELNLLALPSVPEDADLILINDPERDLTEPESKAVGEYLARGGGLLLTTDFETGELPRLLALAASYGLEAKTGLVVEGDSGHAVYAYPYYLLPDLGGGETAAGVREAKLLVVAPMAGGILVSNELPASIAVEELLKTSEKSYLKSAVTD
ncbi:MAG: GldG family protein [Clostridia bacterium]|nr:GldG family protein [Clostridia bacterium]